MVYCDVTDIVHFATRYNRLTGIQRVQVNIIALLARAHGVDAVRCTFFHPKSRQMVEFAPDIEAGAGEFDAERFLARVQLQRASHRLPSKVQIKSYLRRFNNNKPLRTLKKCEVYLIALLAPHRLTRLGLASPTESSGQVKPASVTPLSRLPATSTFLCMGSMWLHPEVWDFAQNHRNDGGEVIQMVHDLIPIQYPQYFTSGETQAVDHWLKASLRYTSRFIAVSKSTAGVLQNYSTSLGFSPRVTVVPLAHEFMGYPRSARVPKPARFMELADSNYVLCVGTIEHRKNATALLKIWLEFIREFGARAPLLVFAGKFGKGSAEFEKFLSTHSELNSHVRLIHTPSDLELAWLYGNALFTTLPSIIEGWGLPVGESAWFGKFCVASNATSIPEVCGELAGYVNPLDLQSMAEGLRRPIVDAQFLRAREAALQAAPLRTWEQVARQIYDCARQQSSESQARGAVAF
jgi:glycosyltransferase involved in cell wall biosynthesis